jgi:hypothetical protein
MNTTPNNPPATGPRFVTKKVLARHYSVSERTINTWNQAGLLVAIKIRRIIRFDVPACDAGLRGAGWNLN